MNTQSKIAIGVVIVVVLAGTYYNFPKDTSIAMIIVGVLLVAVLAAIFLLLRAKKRDKGRTG